MRRLALTSAASTSPPEQALTGFARNRPAHSNAVRGLDIPARESTAVRGNPTLLWVGCRERSGASAWNRPQKSPPLACDRCGLKPSLWFVPSEPKVYLISHISQRCYISPSLPCLHPPFGSHHHSTGNPVPLTRSCNYRVADCVESFRLNVSQNCPD